MVLNGQVLNMMWFKLYFPLYLGVVLYDNEFKTKKRKIYLFSKDKIETQQIKWMQI